METSRDVTLLSSSFADAVLKLDTLIDEQSTELNMRNKHQWWPVVHDAVRKRMVPEEKISRSGLASRFQRMPIRQRDAKRTLQLRVTAEQEVQRMFKRRRNNTPTRSKSCVRLCEEWLLFYRRHENSWVLPGICSLRRNITVHALEAPEGIGNRVDLTGSGHGNHA
jgi:hypothetical protein